MANVLFYAHSGLRFLVLLAGVLAIGVLVWGISARRPYAGQSRAITTVFVGTLDLQVTLGLLLLLTRPWYGALMGHLVMMIAAAFVAHGLTVYARKQEDARRSNTIALAGVALALLLIIGGVMSIRSSPFHMTPGAGATATSTG